MLGTQTQSPNPYPTQAKPVKGRNWRKPVIVIVLLALVGIGGRWAYQDSTARQAQTAPGLPANISAPAAAGQLPGSNTTVNESAVAQTASAGTAASTGSVSAGQPVVQATTPTEQPVDQSPKLASLTGVAEVGGTPVWSNDGTLVATLDSGALLTVKARTSDGTWLTVTTDAGSGSAQASTVIAYGLQNLATAAVPAAVASITAQTGGVASAATAAAATADPSTESTTLSLRARH